MTQLTIEQLLVLIKYFLEASSHPTFLLSPWLSYSSIRDSALLMNLREKLQLFGAGRIDGEDFYRISMGFESIYLSWGHSRILSMHRVGNLQDQRSVGFSRKNTVGKTGLVVDDKKIVDGAEDVVEAYLKGRQLTRTVVLEKSRGQ